MNPQQDIDDSAFAPVDDPQALRPQPRVAVPPPRPAPQMPPARPVQPQPIQPVAPRPAQPPVAPAPMRPMVDVAPPAQPAPAPRPSPLPQPQPVAAPRPAVLPPMQPTPPPVPPLPVAQVAAAPAQPVGYQPAMPHIPKELVERIDEKPQQNSSDIEGLINRNHAVRRLKSFVSLLLFCAGVVVAAYLINQFIFQSYYVDGTSMTPTLQNDDRLIIDKVERTWAGLQGKPYIPERGQIVVLDSSIIGVNGREEQLIKRVIGVPGDTVIINEGVVTIKNAQHPNGFNANQAFNITLQPTFADAPIEVTIPDGQVYVMGDNRAENGSYDSRAFGPIESNKIVGRLWARILPLEKAQIY